MRMDPRAHAVTTSVVALFKTCQFVIHSSTFFLDSRLGNPIRIEQEVLAENYGGTKVEG